jgi:O-antigen/teichoic acid export membrane protein
LALFSLFFYLPALVNPVHDSTTANLLTRLTGYSPVPADTVFYSDWAEAGRQLRAGQAPLWNGVGQHPLLEVTQVPLLYPGSLINYLAGPDYGPLAFSMFHFWLAGLGLTGLMRKIRASRKARNRLVKGLLWLFAAFLLVLVGPLRPDWLAAFSWLPVALLLVYWRRRVLAFAGLALPLGMLALSGPLPLALVLYAVVAAWWLARVEWWRSQSAAQGLRSYTRVAGYLSLAIVGGLFLAGPQLFPRLTYAGPDPDAAACCPVGPTLTAQASGATIIFSERLDYGQWLARLNIPPPGQKDQPTRVEFWLQSPGGPLPGPAGLAPSGWGGQIFEGENSGGNAKRGPDVKVTGAGPTGPQVATITFARDKPPEAGTYTLRLRYNPLSFTLGLYAAFLTLVSLALIVVILGWLRYYREDENDHPLRRVIKNSATPLFAQLTGKVIDFAYAIFVLRLLGPDGNGQYTFAVTTWLIFATISDFGLEGLVTREIARARLLPDSEQQVNRLFVTKFFLRLGFSIAALPISLLWIAGFGLSGNLSAATGWAIILLMVGFWPSALSGSITAIFRGYEKFEYLAAGQLLSAIIKVPLGLAALLAGWGVVGLAGASVVVNFIQVAVLQSLQNKQVFRPKITFKYFDRQLAFTLLGGAFPLMLNGLIISILFKSDGILLGTMRGDTELGLYNSAYKFIDALLIIPSTLTIALFPLFSVYGAAAKDNLIRVYREGLRLLLIIALPISVGTIFVAYDLIGFMGGPDYLPGGAIALQILIWFLPFSYINGLTQYVLIAIDKQRSITGAVVAAAVVNIALNLALIPAFGYQASAAITIVTELVLLVPFSYIMWRALGKGSVPLVSTSWRPILASSVMLGVLLGLISSGINQFVVTVLVGALVYLGMLILTRAFTRKDLALLKKVLKR